MATLTINLKTYSRSFVLPKEWLHKTLPESLFVTALSEDSNATTLELTHPDVSPEVMALLVDLSGGKEPGQWCPELETAHRYLNIPTLLAYADPLYDTYLDRKDDEHFISAVVWADKVALYRYLIRKGYVPSYQDFDTAACNGCNQVLRAILEDKRVNPMTDYGSSIVRAMDAKQFTAIELLLADPRVDPSLDNNFLLYRAIMVGHVKLCRLLLDDPCLEPNNSRGDDRPGVAGWAVHHGHPEIVALVLACPKVDLNFHHGEALTIAADVGKVEFMRLLLTHPRFNLENNRGEALGAAAENGQYEAVKLLLGTKPQELQVKRAIVAAAENGYPDTLALLLENSDINPAIALLPALEGENATCADIVLGHPRSIFNERHLIRVIKANYASVVPKLLETVDPSANNSRALETAALYGRYEIVKLLLADGRCDPEVIKMFPPVT